MIADVSPWAQIRGGRAMDMLHPDAAQIDFRAVADTLAQINRFAGNADKPISVAMHTLIVCDAAEPTDRPYALLHDAHEAHLGDITTPVAEALEAIARHAGEDTNAVRRALRSLKDRHDAAFLRAAGLPPPDHEQQRRIRRADVVALMTERRDFLGQPPRPWNPVFEAVPPLRKVYRLRKPADVADELYDKFRRFLPALAARTM
ncbi:MULTISPECIES: hypothetical protein [Methylosinus]|uniref:Phosphohydrolase n=1 Tax=Methylosinus trichosporium (strain ATCC 35070 / NCIMB 11131 / UNIQEM 75 / OB3b) TaxID=595536 RepID=A0A2D2CYH1_METT3|nr:MULTISPECIES: hypothetical protein [Methylosinus]ATQ67792.1 hypothetical protein CQW49_07715 [Methylosinus trichosporium OB3b]OBS51812.1 hypothetical protein A8B73_14235 [Methylosinus sp. 3S-1]